MKREPITPETPIADSPEHWTVEDCASYFSMGKSTVWAYIHDHRLPSVRVAGQVRIVRDVLIEILEQELAKSFKAAEGRETDPTYEPFGRPANPYSLALKKGEAK